VVGVISGHSGVGPDYVERCIDALRATNAWCVGGRIERVAETPMQHAIAVATSSPLGVGDARHNYATTAEWVDTVFPGMWPREVFDRIGLFDAAMTANEDNELSHRIREAGGRIWYDPSIVIRYHPRATLSGLFSQYRRYALGKVLVFRKHHGAVSWRHVVPGLWVAWLVAGLALGFAWPPFLPIWAAGVLLYGLVLAVGSVRLARRGVSTLRVGAALATLHLAYGIGLWQGLVMALVRR
jgi:GT2 family glycosyltransferase